MNSPIMIDGRNFLDRNVVEKAGFAYIGIGRSDDFKRFSSKITQENVAKYAQIA